MHAEEGDDIDGEVTIPSPVLGVNVKLRSMADPCGSF